MSDTFTEPQEAAEEKDYLPPEEDPNEGEGETNPEGVIDNPESVKNQLGYNPGDAPRDLYDENFKAPTGRPLTTTDVLASQGLVEIWDPTVDNGFFIGSDGKPDKSKPKPQGALRQVSREAALRQIENLEKLKEQIGGLS